MSEQKQEIEYESVTVKVPKALMQLIRNQNYFGRTPEKFFTDCVRGGVCSDMLNLDYDEMKRLERKFKVKSELVVDPEKRTL